MKRTTLCVLLLLVASAPAAFAQQKVTDVEYLYSTYELGGIGLPSKAMLASPNFVFYYRKDKNDPARVREIARQFEYAWEKIHTEMGYEPPAVLNQYRLPVYLLDDVPGTGGGKARWTGLREFAGSVGQLIEIKRDIDDRLLQVVASHETFHIFQKWYVHPRQEFPHSFDAAAQAESHWIQEATAVWIEDEIFPAQDPDRGYIRNMGPGKWHHWWSENNFSLYEMEHQFAYGSSAFFKYLTEHASKGRAVVKNIWEAYVHTKGAHGISAVKSALGDIGPDFDAFEQSFANFCVAVYLKTQAPYDFQRGGEITGEITPKQTSRNWYFSSFDNGTHQIAPAAYYPLGPLSAMYFEFRPPNTPNPLMDPTTLHLVVRRPLQGARVDARVVTHSSEGTKVHKPEFSEGVAHLAVENYAEDIDRVTRVMVVVANASLAPERFEIAGAVGDPPYVQEVKIYKDHRTELIYHARWEGAGGKRHLDILTNGLKVKEGKKDIRNVAIEVTFSRGVEKAQRMLFGEARVEWEGEPTHDRTRWHGQLNRLKITRKMQKEGSIKFKVGAQAPGGLELDAEPASPATLNPETLRWDQYESEHDGRDTHHGGIDEIHQITLEETRSIPAGKFAVDDVFTKAEAESLAPHLHTFQVVGASTGGSELLQRVWDLSDSEEGKVEKAYETSLSKGGDAFIELSSFDTSDLFSGSGMFGQAAQSSGEGGESVLFDMYWGPKNGITVVGGQISFSLLPDDQLERFKKGYRGAPHLKQKKAASFDEAYETTEGNQAEFVGFQDNAFLIVHAFHSTERMAGATYPTASQMVKRMVENMQPKISKLTTKST